MSWKAYTHPAMRDVSLKRGDAGPLSDPCRIAIVRECFKGHGAFGGGWWGGGGMQRSRLSISRRRGRIILKARAAGIFFKGDELHQVQDLCAP